MKNNLHQHERRQFCKATLAALSASAISLPDQSAFAATAQEAFASSFVDVPEAYGPTRVRFDKPLPVDLRGTLYRNGPARMLRGSTRYQHWFDGDGMLHAFQLQNDTLVHRAKMLRTDRYRAEEQAGRFLWSGFGTRLEDSLPIGHPDDINVANISVLPLGEEILALWEAGSPWRVDSETLTTLGRKIFSPETDGLPFSAHPRVDPGSTGSIWNFGYLSGSGKLVLYDLAASGALNRVSIIDAPNADSVHDFAVTDKQLIFVLVPLKFNPALPAPQAFMDRLEWDNESSVQVLVIDKNTLEVSHQLELPPFFLFHLGNAWQTGHTIHIEMATAPDFKPLMQNIVQASTGNPLSSTSLQPLAQEIRLDLNKRHASLHALPTSGIDFPRIDQRFTGTPTNHLYMLGRSDAMLPSVFGFNTVVAMDRKTESERSFDYGSDTIAEEHLMVPSATGREGDGWLIGTSYNWQKQLTAVSVFNAKHLNDGPVARAQLPYSLPLGLHGQFVTG